MTLDEATRASNNKRNEAAFFLAKLREVERDSHHNLGEAEEHFGYYLSAFLSATRSMRLPVIWVLVPVKSTLGNSARKNPARMSFVS